VFAGVPDFRAELVVSSDTGAVEIGEWRWSGTHVDGSPFAMCGVTVMGVEDGRVVWGRMYMEPVDRATLTSTRWCARRIDHRSDSSQRRVARPDSAPTDGRPMQLAW
jgi:hypothetical protein